MKTALFAIICGWVLAKLFFLYFGVSYFEILFWVVFKWREATPLVGILIVLLLNSLTPLALIGFMNLDWTSVASRTVESLSYWRSIKSMGFILSLFISRKLNPLQAPKVGD